MSEPMRGQRTRRSDCVVIVSGGLDSVTLAHYVKKHEGRQPLLLSFDYGQRHRHELTCAQWQASALDCEHVILNMAWYGDWAAMMSSLIGGAAQQVPTLEEVLGDPQPSTYVPNRNMIFMSLAAGIAEACEVSDVYIGVQRHDVYGYWDTTDVFMDAMNNVLRLNRKSAIVFKAPFVDMNKSEEITIGLKLGVDYRHTWSCYRGPVPAKPSFTGDWPKACGECPTCRERIGGFERIGMKDPLPYEGSR